jgi:RimJ/RimL family protein N-acetyltransferase
VTIQKGLEGQDDNLDLLQSYFEELKAVTVEPSSPELDLLTFATCTHYFGVITLTTENIEDDEDAEGEPEEDSVDAGYVASPPPSGAVSFTSARGANRFESKDSISKPTSPEDEKVLKWRDAFLAQLQEGDGEEEPQLLSKGKMRENRNIQYTLEQRQNINVPNSSMSNDPDDYIDLVDDMSSDDDLNSQGGEQTEMYSQFDEAESTGTLGREILSPEQFSSPVKMHEIPTDPKLEAFVYKEAITFRDELRAERIKAYQEASASKPPSINAPSSRSTTIGIAYLASSQNLDDPMHRGQLNIGIYVGPDYIQERGLVLAVKQVVNEAFQDASCHRVQAIIVDHETKLHTLELYTSTGFSREGIGRREFFSPVTHEWKDVFYFAILDTDWMYDNHSVPSSGRPRPKTLWDDLLVCQQREREELLRMEEKTLKRSNSMETIRNMAPIAPSTSISETSSVANSDTASTSSATGNQSPKRKRLEMESGKMKERITRRSRAPSSSASSSVDTIETMSTFSSEWEVPARPAFAIPNSSGASPPITPGANASTSSSECWVMLDT